MAVLGLGLTVLAACGTTEFEVRPVPRIAADHVGKPVSKLEDAFGSPRKIDETPTKLIYVWFLKEEPAGAPVGFHGCEMEVTVDIRTNHVLGYSLANVGWGRCAEVERKVRVAEG